MAGGITKGILGKPMLVDKELQYSETFKVLERTPPPRVDYQP